MTWLHIDFEGIRYDLSHLEQFEFEAIQQATQTRPELRTKIKVSFGWHCYTRSPKQNEETTIYTNHGEKRCFCPIRYELSKRLIDIVKDLSKRKVLQTGKGNYLTIQIVDMSGCKKDYEIYFTLRKSEKKKPLKLYIESAYLRDDIVSGFRQKKRQQAINFNILVYKIKNNQPIPYKK